MRMEARFFDRFEFLNRALLEGIGRKLITLFLDVESAKRDFCIAIEGIRDLKTRGKVHAALKILSEPNSKSSLLLEGEDGKLVDPVERKKETLVFEGKQYSVPVPGTGVRTGEVEVVINGASGLPAEGVGQSPTFIELKGRAMGIQNLAKEILDLSTAMLLKHGRMHQIQDILLQDSEADWKIILRGDDLNEPEWKQVLD